MFKLVFGTVSEQNEIVQLSREPKANARWARLARKISKLSEKWGLQPEDTETADGNFSPGIVVLFLPARKLGDPEFFRAFSECAFRQKKLQPSQTGFVPAEQFYNPVITISLPDVMELYTENYQKETAGNSPKKHLYDLHPDSRFKFLDSSIWHRYVALCPIHGDFDSNLKNVLKETMQHWTDRLFYTHAALATLEFQVRMLQQSFITKTGAGSHAGVVTPFKFHSETWMRRKAEAEIKFFTEKQWDGHNLLSQLKWRALIIDDFGEEPISSPLSNACKKSKTELILRPVRRICKAAGIAKKDIADCFQTEIAVGEGIEKRKILDDADKKLRKKTYDIIFLDYLLGSRENAPGREYGYEFILNLLEDDRQSETPHGKYRRDLLGRHWIFPISSFPFAFPDKLNQLGISHLHEIWHLSTGGDPIATPHLYAYYLYGFMKQKVARYFLYPEALRRFFNEIPVPVGQNNGRDWADFIKAGIAARRDNLFLLNHLDHETEPSPFLISLRQFLENQRFADFLQTLETVVDFLRGNPLSVEDFEKTRQNLVDWPNGFGEVVQTIFSKIQTLDLTENYLESSSLADSTQPSSTGQKAIRVFISYSHKNAPEKEILMKKLNGFINARKHKHGDDIEIWHDGDLQAGNLWDSKIKAQVESANRFIFLASDYMFNSTYIMNFELPAAIEKKKRAPDDVEIVPIVLDGHSAWEVSQLKDFERPHKKNTMKEYRRIFDGDGWEEVLKNLIPFLR